MAQPSPLDPVTINEIVAMCFQSAETEKRRLAEDFVHRGFSPDSPALRGELFRKSVEWMKKDFLEKCLAACEKSADRNLRLLRIADDPASDIFDPYCEETQRSILRAGTDTLRRLEQLAGRGRPSSSPVATSLKAMADLAAAQWSIRVAKVFDGPNGKRSEFALQAREVRAERLRHLSSISPSGPQPEVSAFVAAKTLREQHGKRMTIDQRMKLVLFEKPESKGWNISEFQAELECSRGGIHKTATWKALEAARKLGKAERQTDRHAKTR